MAPKVTVPQPTEEENNLRFEQTNLLKQQREILMQQQRQQTALMPVFAKQLGLDLIYDKKGNITGAKQTADSLKLTNLQKQVQEKTLDQLLHPEKDPRYAQQLKLLDLQMKSYEDQLNGPLAKQNKQIQSLANERTLKALRGELEIDPAVERDIKQQEATLRDRLSNQLGSGYETSSAGIEALQKFNEGANILRSQARKGELTLADQLSMSRQGADLALGQSVMGAATARLPGVDPLSSGGFAFGIGQGEMQNQASLRQVLASPLGIAGGYGQVASGYQMPIGQLMNQRQMQLDANIQNANNSMAGLGALGSIFGSIFALSDASLKDGISQIGLYDDRVPIYVYTMRHTGERKIGVLAQDLMEVAPELVVQIGGKLAVYYGGL